ncbi:CHAT domain-containing protein [Mycena leptocephala]|nr:CHAT domain-containing protein [Mycena leptocephala]
MLEHAVALTPANDPHRRSRVNELANSLFHRFQYFGDLSDVTKAVSMYEDTLALTPNGHPHRSTLLSNLGNSLLLRFNQSGNFEDLHKAVVACEDAVSSSPPGHPSTLLRLTNLGSCLCSRSRHFGDVVDIDKAILVLGEALNLTPQGHPNKPLDNLEDLAKSVLVAGDGLALTPEGHPKRSLSLGTVGESLLYRFMRLGNLDDLNRAILLLEEAHSLTAEGQFQNAMMVTVLGKAWQCRFERLGDAADINKAVSMLKHSIHLTADGHLERSLRLAAVGSALSCRFERLGKLDDINVAIEMLRECVQLTPNPHRMKTQRLIEFANALHYRFKYLNSLSDLNEALSIFESTLAHTLDSDRDLPSVLGNYGTSLLTRFEQLGDLSDINRAVLMQEKAAMLISEEETRRPTVLSNLGYALLRRFGRSGKIEDLEKCISNLEVAHHLTPDDKPNRHIVLVNLGISYSRRFRLLDNLEDLNKAVLNLNTALDIMPGDHASRPLLMNNVGNSLLLRFQQLGDVSDLHKAVEIYEGAHQLMPEGYPKDPTYISNLAMSLLVRYECLSNPHDLEQAMLHYRSAALLSTGPALGRFEAGLQWGRIARQTQLPFPILLEAYKVIIDLLPQLAWLGLSITDRHHHILQAGEAVRDAAAAAIAACQYEQAVEWLEQGRSVVWGQLFNLRTPVDDLKKAHPQLANELISLSKKVEEAGNREVSFDIVAPGIQRPLQSVANEHHENALKRDEVLEEIRTLDGFETFLLPKTIAQLAPAAQSGPVVVVNVSQFRCDALVLIPGVTDEVIHIPLGDFTLENVENLAESLGVLLNQKGRSDRLHGVREGYVPPDERLSRILSELWVRVVKPVLDGLAMTTPSKESPPRIWWCPTGPLVFLPLHAAGIYGAQEVFGSQISDFVISSYTPFLAALINGFRPASEGKNGLKFLAVAQPSAVGQMPIPGTQMELDYIQRHAGGKVPVLRLEEDMATVESVHAGMRESSWVHFACHGIQDTINPTESALLLAGSSRLTLSSIIKLELPHADLAFLSACQTATGAQRLQEESVHLAAGMLLAGYRGVVATMWSIMDNDAPEVASDVYQHLFNTVPPDPTRAAEALHLAVRRLRETPGQTKSFLHWVPFIHVGV